MATLIIETDKISEMLRPIIDEAINQAFQNREQNTAPPQRFTQRAMAKRYRITEPTLIKWRKEGTLEFEEINGRIYYKDEHLNKAFEAKGRKS
jgi:hypothetical protein